MPHDPYALPEFTAWPTFPFEGDLRVKRLEHPVDVEPPRQGEDPEECSACRAPDSAYIWVSQRWRVRALDRPSGLPMVLILESRSHLDLGDLPNLLAAELGVMTVRLERAIRSIEGVARVHINRWGDGSAHLHLWFLARPYGRLQLRGTFLSLWDDILPPIAEPQWRENLALVAAWLAEFGGRPLAEPPPIDWKAPTSFDERGESMVEGPVDTGAGVRPAPAIDWDGEDVVRVPGAVAPPSAESPYEGPSESASEAAGTREADGTDGADGETEAKGTAAAEEPGRTARTETEAEGRDAEVRTVPSDPPGSADPDGTSDPGTGAKAVPTRRRAKATASGPRSSRDRKSLAPDPADPEEAWEEGV